MHRFGARYREYKYFLVQDTGRCGALAPVENAG